MADVPAALALLPGMTDTLQRDPRLSAEAKADALRDLGCLKLQLSKSHPTPTILAALLGSLGSIPTLRPVTDRMAALLAG